MKEIKRDIYLNKLIRRRENGLIKVITGIRRSGKSYLLDPIFRNYLLSEGIQEDLSKMNRCTTSFWMKYSWLMILNIS